MRDSSACLFKGTPEFDARIFDLSNWTFESKIFEKCPALYGVVPKWNSIPRSIGRGSSEDRKSATRGMSFQLERRKKKELAKGIDGVIGGEKYDELKWHSSVMKDGKEQVYYTLW